MVRLKYLNVVSAALILSGLLQACAFDPASSTEDARVTGDVKKAIAEHSDLGAPNQIYVETRGGVVYLSGLVDNGMVVQNAKAVAARVPGVTRVESNLSIDK